MRKTEKKINNNWLPIAIIIAGGILRIVVAIIWGYSNDELSAISRSFFTDFDLLVQQGVMETDMHPVGVQLFITFWQSLFGTDEWIMRLPFIIASSFGLYFFYRFFNVFWSTSTCTVFLILCNFLYFFIPHTLFARPYAFAFFFTGLSLLGVRYLLTYKRFYWKSILIMTIGWTGILYSHYFASLFALWLAMCLLFIVPVKKWISLLLSGGIAGLLFLPHLSITLHHLHQGGLGWLPPPDNDFIVQFLFHLCNESWFLFIALTLLALTGIYFAVLQSDKTPYRASIWALFVFFGIYTIAYLYSLQSTPILKYMVLLFPVPFIIIVFSQWLTWPLKTLQKSYYLLLAILIFGSTIVQRHLFNPTVHYGVFRELAQNTTHWNEQYGSDQITKVTNINAPFYLDFYLQKYGSAIENFHLTNIDYTATHPLDSIIEEAATPYFSYSYSNHTHLAAYHEKIRARFPTLVEGYQFFNSGIWLYENKPSARPFKMEVDYPLPTNLQDSSGWYIIPPQGFTPAVPIRFSTLDFNRYDYFLYQAEVFIPQKGHVNLVGAGQENGKPIHNNGEDYYRASGSEGQLKRQKLYLAFDIEPEWLTAQSELVFYLWNDGNTPIYLKNISLKLVDPEMRQ